MIKSLIAILFTFSILLWPSVASAQTDSGSLRIITSPLPINVAVEPGKTVTTDLRVRNGGNQTEKLAVGLLKFTAFGDSGSPKLLDRAVGDDYFDWVTFSEKQFSLAPNEWHTIKMTIAVPATAAFGYYYAVTFSRATPESIDHNKSQAELLGATATLVLLEAKVPNAKRQVAVQEFRIDKPWYEFLPTSFGITLKNEGNIHVAPRGNIFIESSKGQAVATLEVNSALGNILPDSSRSFSSQWSDGFPHYAPDIEKGQVVLDRNGKPKQHLVWDFTQANHLRMGKYTAHLAMVYDDGHKDVPLEATVSFWVIPWRLLLALAVNVLIIVGFMTIIIVWLIRRRRST